MPKIKFYGRFDVDMMLRQQENNIRDRIVEEKKQLMMQTQALVISFNSF